MAASTAVGGSCPPPLVAGGGVSIAFVHGFKWFGVELAGGGDDADDELVDVFTLESDSILMLDTPPLPFFGDRQLLEAVADAINNYFFILSCFFL